MTMIAEGAEVKRVEEAQEKRKRKFEDDKRWEGEFFFFVFSSCLPLLLHPRRVRL